MKKKLFVLLFTILCICGGLWSLIPTKSSTYAFYIEQSETLQNFVMDEGANFKFASSNGQCGLSYSATMPLNTYQEYVNNGYSAKLMITPYKYIEKLRSLTASKYNSAKAYLGEGKYFQALTSINAHILNINNLDVQTTGSNVTMTGGLKSISNNNYNDKYFGLFYLVNDSTSDIKYSNIPYQEESSVARSLAYVASEAYYSTNEEQKDIMITNIMQDSIKSALIKSSATLSVVDEESLKFENSSNLLQLSNLKATYFDDKITYDLLVNCKKIDGTDYQVDVTDYLDFCVEWNFDNSTDVISYFEDSDYIDIKKVADASISAKIGNNQLQDLTLTISKADLSSKEATLSVEDQYFYTGEESEYFQPEASITVMPDGNKILRKKTIVLNKTDNTYSYENNAFSNIVDGKLTATVTVTSGNFDGSISTSFNVEEIKVYHPINITQGQNGTITSNLTTAALGDIVSLSNTPNTGYKLDYYTISYTDENGNLVTTDIQESTFTMPNTSVNVTATFRNRFVLTVRHVTDRGIEYAPTTTQTLTYGTAYSTSPESLVDSPLVMVDKSAQSGTMPADDLTITYTYSFNPSVKLSEGSSTGAIKIITKETGFSIQYDLQNATHDWAELFLFGDSVKTSIFNGCIRFKTAEFESNWYDGEHGNGVREGDTSYNWHAVVPYENKVTYTISVNPDGSIYWYRAGVRVLWFEPSQTSNEENNIISTFVDYLITEICSRGFTVDDAKDVTADGNYDAALTNVSVGYAVTPDEHTLTIKHTSDDPSLNICDYKYQIIPGYAYNFDQSLVGYNSTSVSGTSLTEDKTVVVNYTKVALTSQSVMEDDYLIARKGIRGEAEVAQAEVNNISGDFKMEIRLKNVFQLQSSTEAWRTTLIGIQNSSSTNIARMFRLDNFSWSSPFGAWTQKSPNWWSSTTEYRNITTGLMNINIQINRVGPHIAIVYYMYSEVTGQYYSMTFYIEDMRQDTINVIFTGEDCTYTIDYIHVEKSDNSTFGGTFAGYEQSYYNSDRHLEWTTSLWKDSNVTGDFTKTITIYQEGCTNKNENSTYDQSPNFISWQTALLVIYNPNNLAERTVMRLDDTTSCCWTNGSSQNTGTVTSSGYKDSLGNSVSMDLDLFYSLMRNSYITYVITRSGNSITVNITVDPCDNNVQTYTTSYSIVNIKVDTLQIHLAAEYASIAVVSVV